MRLFLFCAGSTARDDSQPRASLTMAITPPARNPAGSAIRRITSSAAVPSPAPDSRASGNGVSVVSMTWAIPAVHASRTVSSP